MISFKSILAFSALHTAVLANAAYAQGVGGVFGPVVKEGEASAQYRAGYNPDTEAFAQRLHYQQALNTSVRLRGVVQTVKSDESDVDFDSVRGELVWQMTPDNQDWQSGLRFDVVLRDEDRPHTLGLNWMNQWNLSGQWGARTIVLAAVDAGDNTRDGVLLETRGQLSYSVPESNASVGVEIFSAYGSTDDIRDLEDQNHSVGPYVNIALDKARKWRLFGEVLFGVTDAAPDTDLKLWITRAF